MAKLTLVEVYNKIAANQSELASGVITVKQCRDRISRLAKSALSLGASLSVPTTEALREIAPTPVALDPTVDTNDYESSEEEDYEHSYESSYC